jgi:hypothetical protein
MAFPFLADVTFDDGTKGAFDSETDASSILDFPHYVELSRGGRAPWQGAHAMRARLNGTATGFVTETGTFDTTATNTIHVWFPVLIGEDVTLADTDTVVLFALQSAGPVAEAVFGVRNNAGVYELFFGETGATRTFPITRSNKKWYEIEMSCLIDSGVGDDGTITGYIDGAPVGAAVATLDQGAITQASFGAVSGTAAGNSGTILFGGIIADDARVYPRRQKRYSVDKWVTQDITAFVGSGELDAVSLTATDTNGVLNIYDTDIYEATGVGFSRQPPGMTTPIKFNKGCYVQLAAGAAPQAFLSLKDSCVSGVVMSDANYVDAGRSRKGLI